MAYSRRDIRKLLTRSFLGGAASAFGVFGRAGHAAPLRCGSDIDSLSSDWARVGDSIRSGERKISGKGA